MVKVAGIILAIMLGGCAGSYPPAPGMSSDTRSNNYVIGPGDMLNVVVWHNTDLTQSLPVRPDGKISMPLVTDMMAAGKTPTQLARDIEKTLSKFIQDPNVTVVVTGFTGLYDNQIRVIGQATKPQTLQYNAHMTVLDVMISVGGMTDFAAGNRATIVRRVKGKEEQFSVRLDDLMNGGDISANVPMQPGDILIIPESYF